MYKKEKQVTGAINDILAEISSSSGIHLDVDKFEFLRAISKTKYSGLTTAKLVISLNVLKNKDEIWFKTILEDGLAELLTFQTPNAKTRQPWEGWFITPKGRKILKEILDKL